MIFRIFRKELLDTLRDRRTLVRMIVIPILIFPIITNISAYFAKSEKVNASEKVIAIGVVEATPRQLSAQLNSLPKGFHIGKLNTFPDSLSLKKAVQKGKVDLGLFAQILPDTSIQQERFTWFVDGTKEGLEERATAITQFFQLQHETQRLQQLGIRPEEIHPLQATYINCASQQKMMGQVIGGILPYIFIAFGFIGCMYPAIDLFTGEKERGTLETLLCAPIARWKILTGKMAVIVFSGLAAASFALIGIYISSEFLGLSLDKNITAEVMKVLEPQFLIYSLLLLLPLVVFFAGIMVPIAVSAKSFKEAQSMIGPLNMLVVLPAMVGFFPGFELNALTAMIPVVNVVLATKALLSGTLAWIYLVEALGVMLLLAALSVLFSYRQYGKESNLIN
ncbi:MAG: hypothetical protein RLZZ301_1577 [Bacteroidota bacterium]